jgi:hypothetical protein
MFAAMFFNFQHGRRQLLEFRYGYRGKNVKTSTMFTETEHLIKELIDNIGNIKQNRETNSSAVKEQKRIIENEIQEMRTI